MVQTAQQPQPAQWLSNNLTYTTDACLSFQVRVQMRVK